jgi:hypothetical protein
MEPPVTLLHFNYRLWSAVAPRSVAWRSAMLRFRMFECTNHDPTARRARADASASYYYELGERCLLSKLSQQPNTSRHSNPRSPPPPKSFRLLHSSPIATICGGSTAQLAAPSRIYSGVSSLLCLGRSSRNLLSKSGPLAEKPGEWVFDDEARPLCFGNRKRSRPVTGTRTLVRTRIKLGPQTAL